MSRVEERHFLYCRYLFMFISVQVSFKISWAKYMYYRLCLSLTVAFVLSMFDS